MEINQEFFVTATSIFGAIGAVVFGLQKAIKSWSADRSDIQKIGMETDLFGRMSAEIKRLAETNQRQEQEIIELRDKCATITEMFAEFKIETTEKTIELMHLKQQLIDCNNRVLELQQVNNPNEG